ncbi:hypothetical protein C8J56DRAFT_902485 [Mycena floridula]|nr:hypothetical protein C8J56DRAFT_902485 [Mycena floridula]
MDPSRTSNPLLWLPDTEPGVFLQVKNVLYRVDQIAVQRSSVFLRDLFKFPKASEGSTDGAAEDLPIILDQDTRAFNGNSRAFDIFLLQAHGKHIVLAKNLELHQSILELSRYLRSDSLKALALASIEALRIPSASSAITMIDICFQHGTRIFFADAFDELTRARWSDYTYEQTIMLIFPLVRPNTEQVQFSASFDDLTTKPNQTRGVRMDLSFKELDSEDTEHNSGGSSAGIALGLKAAHQLEATKQNVTKPPTLPQWSLVQPNSRILGGFLDNGLVREQLGRLEDDRPIVPADVCRIRDRPQSLDNNGYPGYREIYMIERRASIMIKENLLTKVIGSDGKRCQGRNRHQ